MAKEIKHNEHNKEMARINLPISMLSRCKDKTYLRLVAVSLYIKAHNGDSNLKNLSIKNIKSFFNVGQSLATKIKTSITNNDELFLFKGYNNSAVAKTFKGEINYDTNRKGQAMARCFVVALDINKSWKLKDLEKYIRKAIILNAINGVQRVSGNKSYFNENKSSLFADKDTLTMKKVSNIIGKSKSTARRELKTLANEKTISIERCSIVLVATNSSDEYLKSIGLSNRRSLIQSPFDGALYACKPNVYRIINRDVTLSYKHIIYNSSKRHTLNEPYIYEESSSRDVFFSRMEQGKFC